MNLKKLIAHLDDPEVINFYDFQVNGIANNSKHVKANYIFVAIKGVNYDGHSFISEALRRGARAVVSQHYPVKSFAPCVFSSSPARADINPVWIKVSNTLKALASLSAQFYNRPSRNLVIIGITGTNGKTTISYITESLLKQAGKKVAVIGTINYRFSNEIITASNTTPDSPYLQFLLARMKKAGVKYAITEVSSHALDQERIGEIDFSYAIFTNLTQDHLDYHKNIKTYFMAKAKLFQNMPDSGHGIINIDDPYGKQLLKLCRCKIITYGLKNKAKVSAANIRFNIQGTDFTVKTPKGNIDISTSLIGRYNVYNILAVVSLGIAMKLDLDIIQSGICKFKHVPGRLERIDAGGNFSVFIDYAHTEDALRNVLRTLKEIAPARTIIVFGCGGDRDKTKRPKMGRAASELADFSIITSDNPRNEKPSDIVSDIVRGIKTKNYRIIIDRKDAIHTALNIARSKDIILIAGKGHETRQVFKNKTIHFDDREVVRQCLKSKN